MKRIYETPAVEVAKLLACDVISTSGTGGTTEPDTPDCPKEPDWRLPWD